jgi:hypothetical protein
VRLALILLAFVYSGALSASALDLRSVASDPAVLAMFADMLRVSTPGVEREVAAFLVRDGDGRISCRAWPRLGRFRAEAFHGEIPNGTVAIAHTHPPLSTKPSRGDIAEAQRIGLPIYVVTRRQIHVVHPGTGRSISVAGNWMWRIRGAAARCDSEWALGPLAAVAGRSRDEAARQQVAGPR